MISQTKASSTSASFSDKSQNYIFKQKTGENRHVQSDSFPGTVFEIPAISSEDVKTGTRLHGDPLGLIWFTASVVT